MAPLASPSTVTDRNGKCTGSEGAGAGGGLPPDGGSVLAVGGVEIGLAAAEVRVGPEVDRAQRIGRVLPAGVEDAGDVVLGAGLPAGDQQIADLGEGRPRHPVDVVGGVAAVVLGV